MNENAISEIRRSVESIVAAAKARDGKAGEVDARIEAITTAQTKIAGQLTSLEQKFAETQVRGVHLPGGPTGAMRTALADMLKGHEQTLAGLANKRGTLTMESRMQLRAIVQGDGDSPAGGFPTQAARDPTAFHAEPIRPLTMLAALAHEATDKAKYTFVRAYDTNSPDEDFNAAAVAEGGSKPEASIAFAEEEALILTHAVLAKISNQLLNDQPGLQAELSRLLSGAVLSRFEHYVVSTLLANSPVYSSSGAAPDRISGALADMQGRNYNQPLVVLNPEDWHTLRISKASTAGSYLAGNWNTGPTPSIWNAPIIVNSAVSQGNALVVDRAAATILDRQLVTAELGLDGDDFSKNLRTLRVEMRGGIAIRQHFGLMNFPLS